MTKSRPSQTPGQACQAPQPSQPFTRIQTASVIARNAVPLIGVLFFGQPAGTFVLLCVFNLALTIAGIGVVGVAVPQAGNYVGTADRLSGIVSLLLIGVGITIVLTGLFGWAIAVFVAGSEQELFTRSLFWSALSIVLCALPGMWRQYNDDIRSKLDQAQRKRRDQPIVFIHLLSAGLIFAFCPYAFGFGRGGMIVAAIAISAMFTFRDLRPDLMRRLAPPSGRSQA
jgi:hypothetical protein